MGALLDNFLFGRQYLALELFHLDQADSLAMLVVERKKNELVISEQEIFRLSEDLSKYKSKLPAMLIINNDKVLQKEIKGQEPVDRKLLHRAFPNLQVDDFYYEIWRNGNSAVVSICRKAYVDDTLSRLAENFTIASVSLGVSCLSVLSGFEVPTVLTTNTQRIALDGSESIVNLQENLLANYSINGLDIPNTHLLAFCGVLKFIIPSITTGNLVELDEELDEKFRQKTFFEKGLKAGIMVVLGLLVINFLLFSYYFDKATQMTETVSLHKTDINNIVKIRQRIKDKEQRLKTFTGSAASASSLVINDLVKNLPTEILLSQLSYHPLEKKIKEGEQVVVLDDQLLISGSTISNTAFTGWIQHVERSKWVNNVTIASFGKDTENNTVFSVTITLKK